MDLCTLWVEMRHTCQPDTPYGFPNSFERRAHSYEPTDQATDASLVSTLEEISNLAAEGGKPADTLMNVVALIADSVPDRCVLCLLASSRTGQTWFWPPPWAFTRAASGPCACRARRRPYRLVAEQVVPVAVDDVKTIRDSNTSKSPSEDITTGFLGVPLVDQGVLQGVLGVQTRIGVEHRETEIRC